MPATTNAVVKSGILLAIAAAVCLGVITTQAKLVYADGGNAYSLMLVRFVSTVTVIACLLRLGGHGYHIPAKYRWPVTRIGLVWSGSMIAYLMSVQTISASLAVLILYTYPLLVLMLGFFSKERRGDFRTVLLFAVAFVAELR